MMGPVQAVNPLPLRMLRPHFLHNVGAGGVANFALQGEVFTRQDPLYVGGINRDRATYI
jgi:hypothetical protein